MLAILDRLNFNAAQFNEEISEKIHGICLPLFSQSKITYFGYVKIFKDGKMFRFSTNKEWNRIYFKNQYYNDQDFYHFNCFNGLPENGFRVNILTNQPNGNLCSALYSYNLWNIFSLSEKINGCINTWFFGADKDNIGMLDFYTNNRIVLLDFIEFFKKQISAIVTIDKKILITTTLNVTHSELHEKRNISYFLNEMRGTCKNKKFNLSVREIDCIQQLMMGKSAKEIGRSLNISFRTVECHINNVKEKVGCKKIGHLLKMLFDDSQLHSSELKCNKKSLFF